MFIKEAIIAYKCGQMVEAREALNTAHCKSPISIPIIFKDLIVVEEIISGFSPRYKFVELPRQKSLRMLIEVTCEICGKKIMAETKHRKYCGFIREKTGCAYKQHIKRALDFYYRKKLKRLEPSEFD